MPEPIGPRSEEVLLERGLRKAQANEQYRSQETTPARCVVLDNCSCRDCARTPARRNNTRCLFVALFASQSDDVGGAASDALRLAANWTVFVRRFRFSLRRERARSHSVTIGYAQQTNAAAAATVKP